MTRPTLMIFTKPARMGLAKTRLAGDLGRAEARRIAMFTAAQTVKAVRRLDWRKELHVTPASASRASLGPAWPDDMIRLPQVPGSLGDRMAAAMTAAPPGPVVFIGTDAPGLTRQHLIDASKALRRHGAVFGPAADGGFWLLGLSHHMRDPYLFDDVRWSTPHAMEDVWSNLPDHASVSLLPQLIDIDTGKDWKLFTNQS